jgi:hypothetical protein
MSADARCRASIRRPSMARCHDWGGSLSRAFSHLRQSEWRGARDIGSLPSLREVWHV